MLDAQGIDALQRPARSWRKLHPVGAVDAQGHLGSLGLHVVRVGIGELHRPRRVLRDGVHHDAGQFLGPGAAVGIGRVHGKSHADRLAMGAAQFDFLVGVGGKTVEADHHGLSEVLHVADVLVQVGEPALQAFGIRVFDVLHGHAAMHLEPLRGGHDDRQFGIQPAARHLMLKNFSAPKSAPNPASVTT